MTRRMVHFVYPLSHPGEADCPCGYAGFEESLPSLFTVQSTFSWTTYEGNVTCPSCSLFLYEREYTGP